MNCKNCGAAMKLVDGRNYFVCEHCTTFVFPSESPASVDRVKVLGERSELSCPVCDVALLAGSIVDYRVYHCPRCRGVLATNEDFKHIVRKIRAQRKGPPDQPKAINRDEMKRQLRCPACRRVLDVHPYYGPGSVMVDTCGRCCLIWLDHGEIGVIERAPGRV
jgi:Zn-finger nucleic acid-binding protein